jgi:hypothetical protein
MRLRRLLLLGVLLGTALGLQGPVSVDVVDGNPIFTDHHQVTVNRTVSLSVSRPNPCSANFGPPCSVFSDYVGVTATAWDGVPNDTVRVALCNGQVITSPVGGGANDGLGDHCRGCDYGNSKGSQLDSNGECCLGGNGFYLQIPSSPVLSQYAEFGLFGSECTSGTNHGTTNCNTQPLAVCPPTPSQIAAGWTCVVEVADPSNVLGQPTHAGYRHVYLKSPIPSMACGGHSCPQFIPTGTRVTVTGVQFPCKTRRLDDTVGTPTVYDGACIGAWTNKTILIKRVSNQALVPQVTPTSQTSALDGSYSITFTMPNVPAGGEQYRTIAHAPTCSLPCDSGKFNASGALFVHQ